MNKAQIKAELRRSACEDAEPYDLVGTDAFLAACRWKQPSGIEILGRLQDDDLRTFFLFVAEAL